MLKMPHAVLVARRTFSACLGPGAPDKNKRTQMVLLMNRFVLVAACFGVADSSSISSHNLTA
jgi:hypothetical protein